MTVYFATDHAGFELKNILIAYVRDELGYAVEDCGAHTFDPEDDYPTFIARAAQEVSAHPEDRRAIILGGSGQGEAMCANRFQGVRAGVFYGHTGTQTDAGGETLDMIASLRMHNNANILSLGARFLSPHEAQEAVRVFLTTSFEPLERHVRRITELDKS